ncbi:hypothetical protein QL285_028338 [Trifolium repens]|nr:hypothetical protein QL285_028338 [Trifolium repens]
MSHSNISQTLNLTSISLSSFSCVLLFHLPLSLLRHRRSSSSIQVSPINLLPVFGHLPATTFEILILGLTFVAFVHRPTFCVVYLGFAILNLHFLCC